MTLAHFSPAESKSARHHRPARDTNLLLAVDLLCQVPNLRRIELAMLKSSLRNAFCLLWVLVTQDDCIYSLLIKGRECADNAEPLFQWNFWINIEHVECVDLAAISANSLIHRYQYFAGQDCRLRNANAAVVASLREKYRQRM